MERVFLKSFLIAGFSYYEGAFVFDKMKIGSKLKLKTEPKNVHDEFAVALYFNDKKIGYIPREENKEIAIILNAGHEIFEAVVQQLSPEEHPERQVRVGLFVLPNKK